MKVRHRHYWQGLEVITCSRINYYPEYEEATRIVKELGHLPLAIDQAGAFLSQQQKPLVAFLPLFEANFNKTLSKKPASAVWQYGERTVVNTWEVSFAAIEKDDPQAAWLLLICAFLSNNSIDAGFLSDAMLE